jgi:hypothetical protein
MSRNLYQRLERLEQQSIPEDESKVWEIIDSDGTATPSGIRIEWPTPGSGHCHRGAMAPRQWRRNLYRSSPKLK